MRCSQSDDTADTSLCVIVRIVVSAPSDTVAKGCMDCSATVTRR